MSFLEPLVVGAVLGFSLAAPPGPVLAKLAFETARGRWGRGFLVGLGATSADGVFFILTWLGLLRVLPGVEVLAAMAVLGAGLMAFFAYSSWKAARAPVRLQTPAGHLGGFFGGFALAATSPFNIGWWLTSGVSFLDIYGGTLALGFFAAILVVVVISVLLVAWGAQRIQRFEHGVSYASAVFLAGFAVFLLHHAHWLLTG